MLIEELGEECAGEGHGERSISGTGDERVVFVNAKRAAVGVGARILFYPTLVYNVLRYMIEPQFHWWDLIDEFLLLGAVPFPSDVPRLKKLGVGGVITLNEPYETLVPNSLYYLVLGKECSLTFLPTPSRSGSNWNFFTNAMVKKFQLLPERLGAHGIEHLLIPTRDYLFAPSLGDICLAVDFIHGNSNNGKITYVHCKAGRGRSTTIVLCYLVQHKQMTPTAAYQYVKMNRPRVHLASSQWKAVQDFYHLRVQNIERFVYSKDLTKESPMLLVGEKHLPFDESSYEVVSQSDLDGYDRYVETNDAGNTVWAELRFVCRAQIARQAAIARISYFWFKNDDAQRGSCSRAAVPVC